jgi:fatty acid desaturase
MSEFSGVVRSAASASVAARAAGTPIHENKSVVAGARSLSRISVARSIRDIAMTWLQLLAIIAFAMYTDSPWVTALAVLLVGARQYGLLILLHDASHGLLHPKRRVNDAMTLWLLAAPCGSSYWNSRSTHLMHHRFLGNSARDPDYFLYCSEAPAPKSLPGQFVWHFVKLVLGGQVVHTLFGTSSGKSAVPATAHLASKMKALVPVAAAQSILLGAFALAGHPLAYFYLWVLPLITLAVLFNGARVFCDHSVPAGRAPDAEALIVTYISNPVERFFLAPFHMNFHAEHHFFPYVPHYNLPKLRAMLRNTPEYRNRIQWRGSYVAYMVGYLFRRRTGVPASTPLL